MKPTATIHKEAVKSASWRYLVRDPKGLVYFPVKSKRAALSLCECNDWSPKWETEGTRP